MKWRLLALTMAFGYLAFSFFFLFQHGFEDPRRALWVGLIGMIVIAVAMTISGRGRKK